MLSVLLTLGKDPELKTLPGGTQLVEINGAFRLRQKDQSGNYKSQWVRVACFGKQGEVILNHFKKGSKILVHADEVHAGAYINQHGQPVGTMESTLVNFAFVEAKQQDSQPQYQQPAHQYQQAHAQNYQQPHAQQSVQPQYQQPPAQYQPPAQQQVQPQVQQSPAQQQQNWGSQAQPNQFEQPPF